MTVEEFNKAAKQAIKECGTFIYEYDGERYHIEQGRNSKTWECWKESEEGVTCEADSPCKAYWDCI